ncbi:MAG: glycosyltransferase family 4 protein [Desulfobacteraceae bacterium]|nr:glycosyltransferase family 4 protein [Desulfobacteraceae bacterium]
MENYKTKILEIGPYPPPYTGWGVRIKYIAEHLRSKGCEVLVMNLGPNRQIASPDYITVQNGTDYVLKIIHYLKKGYTIHMHANGDSPKGFILTFLAEFLSAIFFRRSVLTFHAGPDQQYFPVKNSKLFFPVLYSIFSLPKKVICNSEDVKKNIVEYGIPLHKVVPIPAFSKQYLEFKRTEYNEELAGFIRLHEPVIACYILFRPEFFHESVFRCIALMQKKFPDIGFIIIGGDPETSDNGENVRRQVKETGIEDNTFFSGNVTHDEFLTILQDSAIYLRSHTRDGVCSSVLEALALGVPVVANYDGIRPEEVIQYSVNNENDMAEKLIRTLHNLAEIKNSLTQHEVEDTVQTEAELLINL